MVSASMEAQAKTLGIPTHIIIDDVTRYSDCDAHAANLVSIEGKIAVYKGECNMGHNYESRMEIHELQKMAHIENGEIVYGSKKDFEMPSLENF